MPRIVFCTASVPRFAVTTDPWATSAEFSALCDISCIDWAISITRSVVSVICAAWRNVASVSSVAVCRLRSDSIATCCAAFLMRCTRLRISLTAKLMESAIAPVICSVTSGWMVRSPSARSPISSSSLRIASCVARFCSALDWALPFSSVTNFQAINPRKTKASAPRPTVAGVIHLRVAASDVYLSTRSVDFPSSKLLFLNTRLLARCATIRSGASSRIPCTLVSNSLKTLVVTSILARIAAGEFSRNAVRVSRKRFASCLISFAAIDASAPPWAKRLTFIAICKPRVSRRNTSCSCSICMPLRGPAIAIAPLRFSNTGLSSLTASTRFLIANMLSCWLRIWSTLPRTPALGFGAHS